MVTQQSISPVDTSSPSATVIPDIFRQGMRYLAAGCSIIASDNGACRAGFTATAVASLTSEPPRLLVCVNRNVFAHSLILERQVLSVNVLNKHQEPLARRFAGMLKGVGSDQKFQEGKWRIGVTGAPVLEDALVSFECRVVEKIAASTHDVFVCDVVGVETSATENEPLIYFNGNFTEIVKSLGN